MEPDPFLYHLLTLLGNITDLSALDVGCGAGRNALFLRQKGLSVTGLDPSRHRLAEAEKAATELELRLDMVQGAAERLPLQDESFDLVICTHVLESLDMHTIQRAAEEFHRVVHPGGHLFIITAAKEGSDVGDATEMERNTYIFRGQKPEVRIHLFDEDEIVGLFEGFSVVELLFLRLARPPTVPFSGHWVLVGRKAT